MKPVHDALIMRLNGEHLEEMTDQVAAEIPFALLINGQLFVTLVCTPTELDAMAIGFLLSEGILTERETLLDIAVDEEEATVSVTLKKLPNGFDQIAQRKTITSGCGQGVTFSDGASLESLPVDQVRIKVTPAYIRSVLKDFRSLSDLFQRTGGIHSAALADEKEIILFAEDIGRHNAVDKLIGRAFLDNIPLEDKILLSSGRISGEIMTKVIRNKIPILVSRTAPTCMSLTYAEDHAITLIGFARGKKMNIYTHPQRIVFEDKG
jgi:FdhD protein